MNLALHWLKQQNPGLEIIFLLRHPQAVALSKMKLGWQQHLRKLLIQEQLIHDFLEPFQDYLEMYSHQFEQHLLQWCIENYVPLCQFSEQEMLPVFYESLCENPQIELERIHQFIAKKYEPKILDFINTPSALARETSAIKTSFNSIGNWKKELAPHQINQEVKSYLILIWTKCMPSR